MDTYQYRQGPYQALRRVNKSAKKSCAGRARSMADVEGTTLVRVRWSSNAPTAPPVRALAAPFGFVDCTTGDVKPGHIFFVEREWFFGKSKRSEQRKDWEREDMVQWNRHGAVRVCC